MFVGLAAVNFYHNYTDSQIEAGIAPSPMPSNFKFDPNIPPSQSLKATVSSLSGQIKWQSREATEPADIKTLSQVQQGEELVTGDGSQAYVEFSGIWKITLYPKSELEFSQTLPENLVLVQKSGSIFYQKLGNDTLSIRARHLLINQDSGNLTVSFSEDYPVVVVETTDGTASISYEDSDNVSQKVELDKNQKLTFDDSTRTIRIK